MLPCVLILLLVWLSLLFTVVLKCRYMRHETGAWKVISEVTEVTSSVGPPTWTQRYCRGSHWLAVRRSCQITRSQWHASTEWQDCSEGRDSPAHGMCAYVNRCSENYWNESQFMTSSWQVLLDKRASLTMPLVKCCMGRWGQMSPWLSGLYCSQTWPVSWTFENIYWQMNFYTVTHKKTTT